MWRFNKLISFFVLVSHIYAAPVWAGKIYWVEMGAHPMIFRADNDGTYIQPILLLPGFGPYTAFTLDWAAGKIYFSVGFASAMMEANLNGENRQPLISNGFYGADRIAFDHPSQTLFWTQTNRIDQFALEDPKPQNLLFGESMKDLAVDSLNERIYWGEYHNEVQWCKGLGTAPCHCLHRANLDGSGSEAIHCETAIESFHDIDVLSHVQRVFWLNPADYQIRSSDLDGGDVQTILDFHDGVNQTEGFTVDPVREKIYWVGLVSGSGFWLHEAELDGSGATPVFPIASPATTRAMAFDPRTSGDIDFDGHVAMKDFAEFQNCFASDFTGGQSKCSFFDAEFADGLIDADDAASFSAHMNGP